MVEKKNEVVIVDGGMLEGGGQLFRMSVALAYIFKRHVIIEKIRANRPRGGGLSNQHLTGLQAVVNMVPGCVASGVVKKSKTVNFNPKEKKISRHEFIADCGTPGAVGLIIQMLMPCLLFQEKESCKLSICGGTFVGMSPTVHPIEHVLLPHLKRMGADATLTIESNGFTPNVVGKVLIEVNALKQPLAPFELTERGGELLHIDVYVATTEGQATIEFQEKFKPLLLDYLKDYKVIFHEDEPLKVPEKSRSEVIALSAVLRYPNDTMLHSSILVEGSNQLYSNQKDYAHIFKTQIVDLIKSKAVIDEEHQDQVLIYAAMAKGQSKFITHQELSLHTQTMIVLLQMFCPVKIATKQMKGATLVTIDGFGTDNS